VLDAESLFAVELPGLESPPPQPVNNKNSMEIRILVGRAVISCSPLGYSLEA
jgi:hypothetical protein